MAEDYSKRQSKPHARRRAFDDLDDDDHYAASSLQREEIVSFDRDGARGRRASPAPAAPRVIPGASNLDWRQDRRQRLGVASKLQSLGPLVSMRSADSTAVPGAALATYANGDSNTDTDANDDAMNTEAQKTGLQLRTSRPQPDNTEQKSLEYATDAMASGFAAFATTSHEAGTDQEALKALLAGEGIGGSSTGEPLIIQQPESESEALQSDIDSRPEAPSLDDYAATPIDQFGMALLRGMGWKEGSGAGKGGKGPQQAPEPKKRAALLGLGAKERPAASSGLPTSSSSSRIHRPKDKRDYKYVPVAKRDSEPSSRDVSSSRDSKRREGDDSNNRRSRDPQRHRSRSPSSRSKDHDRSRHRDSRRDDGDGHSRKHGTSRSEYVGRSERDRGRDGDRDREHDDRRNRHHRH